MYILRFIGTSKVNYTIIDEKKVLNPTSLWGWSAWGKWTKVKTPVAYQKTKVQYDKLRKDYDGHTTDIISSAQTVGGTSIPSSKTVTVEGINYTVPVQHQLKGRTVFSRPAALRSKSLPMPLWKMYKTVYNPVKQNSKAYWYRTRSRSIPTYETTKGYEKKSNGYGYLYFADKYWADGASHSVANPYPHPTTCDISYVDIAKSQDINNTVNESDRDSKGYYILKTIRSSVVKIDLEWTGLSINQTSDILKLLSPDVKNDKDYLLVQYYDPEKGDVTNKTMFCDSRSVVKYANGTTKSLSCTLVEV